MSVPAMGAQIPRGYVEMKRVQMLPEEVAYINELMKAAHESQKTLQEYGNLLGGKYVQHSTSMESFLQFDNNTGEVVIYEPQLVVGARSM